MIFRGDTGLFRNLTRVFCATKKRGLSLHFPFRACGLGFLCGEVADFFRKDFPLNCGIWVRGTFDYPCGLTIRDILLTDFLISAFRDYVRAIWAVTIIIAMTMGGRISIAYFFAILFRSIFPRFLASGDFRNYFTTFVGDAERFIPHKTPNYFPITEDFLANFSDCCWGFFVFWGIFHEVFRVFLFDCVFFLSRVRGAEHPKNVLLSEPKIIAIGVFRT